MCLSPSVTCKGPVIDYGEEEVLQNNKGGGGGGKSSFTPRAGFYNKSRGLWKKVVAMLEGGGGGGHNRFGGSFIMGT